MPAGQWNGSTNYGEWFLEETKMPVSQYEKFADQFNPVKFDAKAWVRMAKNAGMKCLGIAANGRESLLKQAGADLVVEDFAHTSLDDVRSLFV